MTDLLKRLDDDGIEHLSVIYHDYSGRSCAKTVPRERFGAVARHGVVFARREVVRNRAREAGWVASFMPKPYAELPGCGLHVHLSTAEAQACGLEFLPSSLPEALDAFEADTVLTEALGPVISAEFLNVKRSELAAYELAVHPWERAAYLETF